MSILVAAFLLGLFGSAHCVAMCGGVACALSGGVVRLGRAPRVARSTLAYNVGRIGAYAALGALIGLVGQTADAIPFLAGARVALRLLAGLLLVGAGLYVAGLWSRYARLERIGAPVWRRVRPIATALFASDRTIAKLATGALWGFMPCGLVYAAFALALSTGTVGDGALAMLAFGLGTAPAMIATGLTGARIASLAAAHAWVRRAAGAVVVAFGIANVGFAVSSLRDADPAHARSHCAACHAH